VKREDEREVPQYRYRDFRMDQVWTLSKEGKDRREEEEETVDQ
jgi:hypothetical protein